MFLCFAFCQLWFASFYQTCFFISRQQPSIIWSFSLLSSFFKPLNINLQNVFEQRSSHIYIRNFKVFCPSFTSAKQDDLARMLFFLWQKCISFVVSVLSPGQTIATCQRNISQHCWAQHVACVWPPCCDVLRHVACCWLKFENGQISPNNTQHIATCRNRVAKRTQHVAPSNVGGICCVGMLRSFGRGFK